MIYSKSVFLKKKNLECLYVECEFIIENKMKKNWKNPQGFLTCVRKKKNKD